MTRPALRGMRVRHIEDALGRRLAEEPVIVLSGARSVGKSTLLQALAGRVGSSVIDLDDLATRDAAAADPAFYADGPGPVLIDEFQHVPVLLDAIKAELNQDLRSGRYVLTGSTRYDSLPLAAQSLTGRVHVMTVWPLSQGELVGRRERFLDRLVEDPAGLVTRAASTTARHEYADAALAGGFPLALQRPAGPSRSRWYRDYLELVLQRDVLGLRQIRRQEQLPRLLRHLVAQTAQPLNVSAAAARTRLTEDAAEDYTRLLEAVFLIHRLPAWGTTLGSRTARHPKIHVVDTGLGGWLLGLSEAKLMAKSASALTEFGRLLESFAVNEVHKQVSWSDHVLTLGHYRTHDDVEVDLVVERDDGAVAGVEVKAGSRVPGDQLLGLRRLRDRLGDQFLGGVALYTGSRSYTAEDRIHVVPVDRLWH